MAVFSSWTLTQLYIFTTSKYFLYPLCVNTSSPAHQVALDPAAHLVNQGGQLLKNRVESGQLSPNLHIRT